MTNQKQTQKDWTVVEMLDWTAKFFKNKGVSESRLDAEILLADILQIKRLDLYLNFDRILNLNELASFKENIQKRVQGIPVAYINWEKGIYGFSIQS